MADQVSEQYLQCPSCEQFSVDWRVVGIIGRERTGYWCSQCEMMISKNHEDNMQERGKKVYRLIYAK